MPTGTSAIPAREALFDQTILWTGIRANMKARSEIWMTIKVKCRGVLCLIGCTAFVNWREMLRHFRTSYTPWKHVLQDLFGNDSVALQGKRWLYSYLAIQPKFVSWNCDLSQSLVPQGIAKVTRRTKWCAFTALQYPVKQNLTKSHQP